MLGDGRTLNRWTPRAVVGGLNFARVTAGGEHTCGETIDNGGYCWGANYGGGLGDGTTITRLRPVTVLGGLEFAQITAGSGSNSCGVTPKYVAYCWGNNQSGAIGDGTTINRLTPVPVTGPS
jgi:alpha-tubulin suppressor-like RCC1 family protein